MKRLCLVVVLVSAAFAVILLLAGVPLPAAETRPSGCGTDLPVNIYVTQAGGTPAPAEGARDSYQAGDAAHPYSFVPDAAGPWYITGKGPSKIDAHFRIADCTNDLSINFSGSSRRLEAYLPDAGGGSLNLRWMLFDEVGTTSIEGGDAEDAEGNWYFRRSMSAMGGDVANRDTRIVLNPPVWPVTSWVRVYHPAPGTWVLAPELTPDATWEGALSPTDSHGAGLRATGGPCRFRIVVCKTASTSCNVNWPY